MPFFTNRAIMPLVVAPTGVTWANPTSHISLSGGNLVATSTSGVGSGDAARTTTSHTTGKYYVEVTFTNDAGTINTGIGVVGSTFTLGGTFVGNDANSICYYSSAAVFTSGGSSGWLLTGTMTTGDVWGLAIDCDNRKTWARKNNGIWNADAGSDPAANTIGMSISGFDSAVYVVCDFQDTAGSILTANFAGTSPAWSFTAPSGFVAW